MTALRTSAAGALQGTLRELYAPADHPAAPPVVATLGVYDVLDEANDPEAAARPAATVHLGPAHAVVGPFRAQPTGPCGHCLALRWQRLRPEYERQALELGTGTEAVDAWPLLLPTAVEALWQLYLAAVAAEPPADRRLGAAWVWALELETLHIRRFPLIADPLCPGCGGEGTEPRTGELSAAPKPAPDTYRARTTDSFALPEDALVNPVCGILGPRTFHTITSPTTAPVTGRVMIKGHYGLAEMTFSGQDNSFRTSRDLAFFEGLERYAGIARRHRAAPLLAAYDDIRDQALDPRTCGTYSDLTYELDDACDPFDPARPIPWVWGRELTKGRDVLVPRRLVYYGGETSDDNFVFDSSNGCASGGTLAEAILFGLLELIERDSFVLGWYGGATLTEIDVSTVADPELRMMLDRAALQGYDVHLFDNRIDLPVPAVTGLAVRRDRGPGTLSFAAAASLDPHAALRGAVSEILTYLPELPRRFRDREEEVRAMPADYFRVRQLRDHPALFSLPEMLPHVERYTSPARTQPFAEVYADWQRARPRTTDVRADVTLVTDALAAAGHEVIVVEQTSPEQRGLGIHTVATIVPGLLPLDFGWARQRARHMPRMFSAYRRAGLRDTDLTPADLIPIPHPFP
ncbi:TOMM precursor leader peptide-binding protein [Streptomyces rimosus]|uniref:TOMM precursor leader peptide-binding protein n=1 Tax=Streptomyces rimosus TaxID=1927 RepID=UPI00099EF81E|nr:TOMM precursor leader peptide-binding protein [Streptomyces rimosus]